MRVFFDIGFDTEAAGANTLVQRSVFLTISDTWSEPSPAIGVRDSSSGLTMYADFSVVPEPSTAALLTLGLAGVGLAGRPKRQQRRLRPSRL